MHNNSLSKLEQKEIEEVLNQLGLNYKEQAVYLALVRMGASTISPIAKTLKYPVTTVQSILARLEKRGILQVSTRKSRHIYEAGEPEVLKKIIERNLQDVVNIIPLLKKLKTDTGYNAKIKIYYRERMADIFHEALQCQSKLIYEIVSARDFQDILGEKFHFTKRRMKDNVYLKSLRVEKMEIKKYNKTIHARELREAKFLPAEMDFRSSIMIWDDSVAFFSAKDEGLAWVVESRSLSDMMKQMFEMFWSVSRRMETLSG